MKALTKGPYFGIQVEATDHCKEGAVAMCEFHTPTHFFLFTAFADLEPKAARGSSGKHRFTVGVGNASKP
jgi:hypothetical protein